MIAVDQRQAEEVLGHPLGRRKTDDKLALAATLGHLGRSRPSATQVQPPLSSGTLTEGFEHAIRRQRRAKGIFRRLFGLQDVTPVSRRWWLPRLWQLDQGQTPQCVAYAFKHCELSRPIAQHNLGLPPAENYRRAKQIDGAPNEDGTYADAMLRVYEAQGLIDSSWWWSGPQDNDAANEWLLRIGGLALGAYWTESMFRTFVRDGQETGLIVVEGEFRYGHETWTIGYNKKLRRKEIVQSWGNDNYGISGRGYIEDEAWDRLMAAGGDLVGVLDKRAA